MSWEIVELGKLYDVHNGLSKSGKFFGTGFPFLSFSVVFNNYFIPNELTDLVQSTDSERENYSIQRGDVFVTRTSETSDELGMSCVALKDYPTATYNGFTKRLRPVSKDRVLPEYIGYYMRMPSFRGEFQAFSTMTTRASLRNEDLLSLQVALPPMKTQEKIAGILMAYDCLIENNQKQIKLLEEAVQCLYKEWFVNLRFSKHKDMKIVDGVPKGWKKATISDLGTVVTGKTPSTSNSTYYGGNVPFVKIPDMHAGIYTLVTEIKLSEAGANSQRNKFIPRNSLMVSCIGTAGLVNISCCDCQTNQQINSIILKNEYDLYYAYFTLKNLKDTLNALGSNGATMTNVNKDKFSKIEIMYPDKKVVKDFHSFASPIFDRILTLSKQNVKVAEVRDCVLPKLMNGEIEV